MAKLINIYGAPGSGKSTTAAGLFYEMKKKHYKVELAYEWIKLKVYEGTPYPFIDQIYTFGKQHKQINQLKNAVDYIITDSPLLLSLLYGKNESEEFKDFVKKCYSNYDNYDFLIERNHPYCDYGRNQNEEQSIELQKELQGILLENSKSYFTIKSTNAVEEIVKLMNF